MSAVVAVESGGNPLALHDNTAGQSFVAADAGQAAQWASALIALGHSVDLGLSQINSQNLAWVGLTVTQAFETCSNLRAGATILSTDYASASRRFGSGQYALRRALGAYNSGSLFAGNAYVDRILVAAGLPPEFTAATPPAGLGEPRAAPPKLAAPKPEQAFYRTERTPGSPVLVIIGTP